MSRSQWGHGYWKGVSAGAPYAELAFPPHVFGWISVWHWDLRRFWWRAIRRPVRVDASCVAYVTVTVFGVTAFLDFTRR